MECVLACISVGTEHAHNKNYYTAIGINCLLANNLPHLQALCTFILFLEDSIKFPSQFLIQNCSEHFCEQDSFQCVHYPHSSCAHSKTKSVQDKSERKLLLLIVEYITS